MRSAHQPSLGLLLCQLAACRVGAARPWGARHPRRCCKCGVGTVTNESWSDKAAGVFYISAGAPLLQAFMGELVACEAAAVITALVLSM